MNNFPDLYFDYVGATGENSITDYIDYTSNNNFLYTSNSSNILDNKIIITSNYLNSNIISIDDKYKVLIKEETEGILKHTYITNSNIQGQIRFITKFNDNDYRYLTRIRENGEIEVYYSTFNILYPTMFVGWYSVMNSIRDAYNYQVVAGELIGGALLSINDIYQKYYGLVAATGASLSSITAGQLTTEAFANITISASRVVNYNRYNQVQAILGITGIGAAGLVYSYLNGVRYDNIANNILSNLSNLDLNIYSNITQTEKDVALSNLINDANLNIIETNNNFSNLGLFNGFINSNIITTQYINSINTNELKLNNLNISNIFVSSNVASNTSYGFSNDIFSSSNLNFNYTSNSLFSNLKPIYSSSNAVKDIILQDTPRVNKKSAFYCQTTNVIYPNFGNTPYYAYHIDLRNYTQTGYIQIGSQSGDTYRVFNIKCFFGSCYYQRLINGIPDIVDYTIYMSYKASSAGGDTKQGLNILATGIPQSYYLDTITPNRIFLLRNAFDDFNYISVVTTSSGDVRVFIEDLLS